MARLYVGTYAKYNNGSIAGKWLDLEDYADKEDFLKACYELHKDEVDPELMFQDFEGFPKEFYCECSIEEVIFEYIELEENQKEIVDAYLSENFLNGDNLETILEKHSGTANSIEDIAEQYFDDCEAHTVPDHLRHYIDMKAYARDLEFNFIRYEGEVYAFNNY